MIEEVLVLCRRKPKDEIQKYQRKAKNYVLPRF